MKFQFSKEINLAVHSFTKKERRLIIVLALIFVLSSAALLWNFTDSNSVEVPSVGGSLTEGLIGAPHFINPLLAVSDTDRDLTQLIYSGLLRVDGNGNYIPDLADSYEISADGLSYTFYIRKNAIWQDGYPVTSDDVEFTINEARDPAIKSPRRANFEGVTVEKIDDKTVKLSLKQPYSSFLENMMVGILPKHLFKDTTADSFTYSSYNLNPIGTGPYKIAKIQMRNDGGGLPEYYSLIPFANFTLGEAKIANFYLRFYQNENDLMAAFYRGEVEAVNSLPPDTAQKIESSGRTIQHTILPRIFAVFFNQNHSKALGDLSARTALSLSVDKKEIVDKVLLGYGTVIDGPIPMTNDNQTSANASDTPSDNIAKARSILQKGGWKFNKNKSQWEKGRGKSLIALSFNLATVDIPELTDAARIIQNDWQQLGVKVSLQTYNVNDLNQNLIHTRKYDALLFGEVLGRIPDLFSFWHSSQRNDPGANISMYTNSKTDKILEAMRAEVNPDKRAAGYSDFQAEIKKDVPAIFLYSPYFIYYLPTRIKKAELPEINIPSDRFLNIYDWYITTSKVWKIFLQQKINK